MFKFLTTAALLMFPFAGHAQSFGVPEGCEGVLTVQQRGCLLVNVWQCEADPEGDKWIALIGEGGPFSVQHIDDEFQWIEAFKSSGNESLELPAPDPASMTELLENGIDTFEFVIQKEGGAERNVGFDALTGVEVVIDGEPLLQTEFEGKTLTMDGVLIDEGAGRQYVSTKHRLFFFGQASDTEAPDQVTDMSPVEFIYPDEPGFFSSKPKFECGVVESGFVQ
ncbi:hypothetical protein [Yoonia sp. MH D7]